MAVMTSFTSCNKEDEEINNEETSYYIKAKINGELVQITTQNTLDATLGPIGSIYGAAISGETPGSGSNLSVVQAITIQIFDPNSIKVRTYSGLEAIEPNLIGVSVGYFSPSVNMHVTDPNNAVSQVIITLLNEKEVKGSFSGVLKDILTGNTINLTEGEFFVGRLS